MTEVAVRAIAIDDLVCPACGTPTLDRQAYSFAADTDGVDTTHWWKGRCSICRSTVERHRLADDTVTEETELTEAGRRMHNRTPLTVVADTVAVTELDVAHQILKTRAAHGPTLQAFHNIWYQAGHTWCYTDFAGVQMMKCPLDLWVYQIILTRHRPRTIIETGTYHGASALWFAFLLDALGIDGLVYTIDIEDRHKIEHPRIEFYHGDSRDPVIAANIRDQMAARGAGDAPVLVSLDADHGAAHVRAELELWSPFCRVGDWLVVEDTNISWPGAGGDTGAAGALEGFLAANPGRWFQDVLCERYLLTMNPGGWLRRIA